MTTALAPVSTARPPGPAAFPSQADSDDGLFRLWLHGRPATTVRAYQADADRFRAYTAKPLRMVSCAIRRPNKSSSGRHEKS